MRCVVVCATRARARAVAARRSESQRRAYITSSPEIEPRRGMFALWACARVVARVRVTELPWFVLGWHQARPHNSILFTTHNLKFTTQSRSHGP